VFTTELGGPVDPRNLLRVIGAAAKTAGVEGVGKQAAIGGNP
jgi:integrase